MKKALFSLCGSVALDVDQSIHQPFDYAHSKADICV